MITSFYSLSVFYLWFSTANFLLSVSNKKNLPWNALFMVYSLQLFQALKSLSPASREKKNQKKQLPGLQTLNKVALKSSSLNDFQQSNFAGCYWCLQHPLGLSSWAATESEDCTLIPLLFYISTSLFFVAVLVWLGIFSLQVFIRFFFWDWQDRIHSGIYSGWRLFPSVSYPG